MKKIYVLIFIVLLLAAGGVFIYWKNHSNSNAKNIPAASNDNAISQRPKPTTSQENQTKTETSALAYPIAEFNQRISKKPFGIYITPQNSPVQPERFSGYHTGADIEYQDVGSDVPVYAIADGTVVLSRTASGYGGVFMILVQINSVAHTVLYGHIRPSSLPKVGEQITKGQPLAVLGTGYSSETDGERRHLHFAVLSDDRQDIKGYVANQSQLSGWVDPVTLYQ